MSDGKFTCDFGHTAQDYARHRAGYPDWFFDRLAQHGIGLAHQRILDLGTGTGALAREFARRRARVTGLDPSEQMLEAARALSRASGLEVDYIQGKAEETGFPDESFDVVTAACCWHWFDQAKVSLEIGRLLALGGLAMICSMDWIPFDENVVAETEALICKYNPTWPLHGGNGIKPEYLDGLREAALKNLESFSVDLDITYSHEAWRGRIRASAGVAASLSPDQVAAFDAELGRMLASRFPQDPLSAPHRIFAAFGRKVGRSA